MSGPVRDTGWYKSSYSSADSDDCVEVRITNHEVGIRDSKNPDGPTVQITTPTWTNFLTHVPTTSHAA